MRWLRRLGRTVLGQDDDRNVADELRLHVEMEAEDLVRQGVPAAEARRRASVALGGAARYREQAADTRGVRWLADFGRDIGYTARSLRRAPGFTLVVVLTLALGIGANATFFSILNTLVLKPLPVRDPGSLVRIDGGDWTYPIFEQVRAHQARFAEAVFAWAWSWTAFNLADGGARDPVDGAYVSGDIFGILGVHAARGRMLTVEDDEPGGGRSGPVAVISHRFWQNRFGGAGDIVGRRLVINGEPITIVGVAPRSFFGLDVGRSFDVMLPFALKPTVEGDARALEQRSHWWVSIGARLAPGQTLEQAQAALRAVQPQIRGATIPGDYPPQAAAEYLADPLNLVPAGNGQSVLRSRYQPVLLAIMVVAGMVLLIACANVANLLLARATARGPEIAVRLALGASRARIATQLLAESVLLSAMGAAAGLLVALWGGAAVVRQLNTWREDVFLDLSPDWRVFAFLTGVTALTTIVFGLAPAWRARSSTPHDALRQGGRGSVGDSRLSVRSALVVSQIALSLMLLVAAGLFLRTFVALSATPLGMRTDSLGVVQLTLPPSSATPDERFRLVDRLRLALGDVPGITATALAMITPLSGQGWNTAVGEGPRPRERLSWMNAVSPGWFDAVGARVLEGRDFTGTDAAGVAIVNEAFARRFLSPGGASGQTFQTAGPGGVMETLEVVGVTSDVLYRSPREGMAPTVFVPASSERLATSLMVRFAPGQEAAGVRAIAGELRRVDPQIVFAFRSLDELASATLTQERLTAGLSVAFGGLALLLAAIGLYGLMSYAVSRRRAEFAVRMALGADRRAITRLVVGQGTALVLAGVALGAAASWWTAQFVQTLLFQLDARDLKTMAAAAAVLAGVGLTAAWLPARRASSIGPAELLRDS